MSTTDGWVQTHLLTTYANNQGWCGFYDILGAGRHSIIVFADSNFQKRLRVIECKVWSDNVQVPSQLTVGHTHRYKIYWFDVSGTGNQHIVHQQVKVALNPPGQGSRVFIRVYQHRYGVRAGEFDLASPIRPVVQARPVRNHIVASSDNSDDCCVIG